MAKDNPIIEIYKGVNVRRCNVVVLKFGVSQYKKILDSVDATGLSVHKVIAYSGQPCDKCKGLEVTIYDKNDNPCKIKRGLITVPENNGINIIQQAKNKSK